MVLSLLGGELRAAMITGFSTRMLRSEGFALALALAAAPSLTSCTETHFSPDAYDRRRDVRWIYDTAGPLPFPDIDQDARLATLDPGEWLALCEWRSSIRPTPDDAYYCNDEGMICPPETARFCGPYHNWRTEYCLDPLYGEAGYYADHPGCAATVADWVTCMRAEAEAICYLSPGRFPTAQCAVLDCSESR